MFSVAKFKSGTPLMYNSNSGEISYDTCRCAYINDLSMHGLCSLKSTADCINCACTVD